MTSSTEKNVGHLPAMTTTSNFSSGNSTYVGDFFPQPQWYVPPQPVFYPAPQPGWSDNTFRITTTRKTAHATTDPTIVNHCPFCGSGALTGRSDGGVDCGVCHETFRVSRQPLYSNEPSAESGAGVESFDNDPLTAEDPFAAPEDGPPSPEEMAAGPEEDPAAVEEEGASNEEQALPEFMSLKSKSGVHLDIDDFLLHHAIRSSRGE